MEPEPERRIIRAPGSRAPHHFSGRRLRQRGEFFALLEPRYARSSSTIVWHLGDATQSITLLLARSPRFLRPRHQKRAKHGRFRPFRAVPRGLRLQHATRHLKRYNYDLNHLCLRFLLAPDWRLPTEYFWHFWAFLPEMTFLPPVEAVAVGCVFFPRGRHLPRPLGRGLGPLRLSPRI